MRKTLHQIVQSAFVLALILIPATVPVRADLVATGMAKPIADLRDYNGTYYGTPGTGTKGYSGGTLYRDNQDGGATSGCEGEGCGSHPGVDIPVNSGTPVYATRGGTIVRSECNTSGWGGLIVIASTNPWNTSETIYFTYAHLRSRYYSSGTVTTGTQIGESGGGSGDTCPGASTGPHLHYQIDRNDGNNEPWFPSMIGRSVHTADSDFQAANKTYNPVVFAVGGYRWTFDNNGDREGWDLFNFSSWGVSGGALWTDGNADPFIRRGCDTYPCDGGISAEASVYNKVHINMYNHCYNNPLKVYFTTSSSSGWSESKSVSYNLPAWGASDIHVNMSSNANWSGTITGIRLDSAVNCTVGAFDPNYVGNFTIERSSH